MIHIDSID